MRSFHPRRFQQDSSSSARFAIARAGLSFACGLSLLGSAASADVRGRRPRAAPDYWASASETGLQAANPAQRLRTRFERDGIRVHAPSAAAAELLSLRVTGVGRGEALAPLPPGEVSSQRERVEIRRPGFREWYVNTPAGLEQGFTLAARPPGEGALAIELGISGAAVAMRGESIRVTARGGRHLDYGKLLAVDAGGTPLVASLAAPAPDRIRIRVDDLNARYPLTIDPLLSSADTVIETNQTDGSGRTAVAAAGDVNGDGYGDVFYQGVSVTTSSSSVFHGSPTGIPNGNPSTADFNYFVPGFGGFGSAVARVSSGDFNGDGTSDLAGFGCAGVCVYYGSPAGITSGPGGNSLPIGAGVSSVAGAGDVNGDGFDDLVVGHYIYANPELNEGAAYVFHGSASGIGNRSAAQADALIQSNLAEALLGSSVSGAGDVNGDGYDDVIVGAPRADLPISIYPREGAAYVFHGSASGIPDGSPETADTRIESDDGDSELGATVAGAGDINGDGFDDVVIAAPWYDHPETDEGVVLVFHGSATGIASGGQADANALIDIDDSYLGPEQFFGHSVDGAGDVNGDGFDDVVAGFGSHDDPESNAGVVLVYYGSSSGLRDGGAFASAISHEGNTPGLVLGGMVAGLGDINGDGLADIGATASGYSNGEFREGAAFLYLGDPDLDRDRVSDTLDNCTEQPNESQIDADGDGCGNSCDADFDQSGLTSIGDFITVRLCFSRAVGAPGGPAADPNCLESDMDGSGTMTIGDFNLYKLENNLQPLPGPSNNPFKIAPYCL